MLQSATAETLSDLREALPEAAFRTDTAPYLKEPRGRFHGHGSVVAPATVEEVAIIVRHCCNNRIGIVPYGGGTGLVGGQVLESGPAPVILSLERMSAIREVRPAENVMIVEAGAILADVQNAAADADRLFPMSLASEGSARIGGLLATNAGGVNVVRYGNMRAQCLGLEVVTATGDVWRGLTRLRKDNTGYDLRDLFVGSEGTLGIITAAALRMVSRPRSQSAAFFAVPSPEAALDLLAMAQDQVGDGLSAIELIHRQGLDFLREVGPDVRAPFDTVPEWMVLLDIGLATEGASETMASLFETAFTGGIATDGVISSSDAQRAAMWHLRESIPEANKRVGSIASHDISVPISVIPDFIREGRARLGRLGDVRINCFGHIGDGNLHYNVFPVPGRHRDEYAAIRDDVQATVHDLVHEMEGSISAEHGIGRLKVPDLARYGDPVKLALMRNIKSALDPHGIMNPGAVIDGD